MSEENQTSINGRLFSLFRKREEWNEVRGYHLGDIHSPHLPVSVQEGSTVVGNIIAPKVVISGLLCGSLVTTFAQINKNGQIWGDLFAVGFSMEPGGRIQGWVSSIDEHTAVSLQTQGEIPEDTHNPEIEKIITENVDSEHLSNHDKQDISLLHLLQTEAAHAHAARAEIEYAFDERIKEVAGGSSETISELTDQLQTFQTGNSVLTGELTETKETLGQKVAQLERHQAELELTRAQISKLQQEQDDLKTAYQDLFQQKNKLDAENKELLDHLSEANLEIDTLNGRVQNVEQAMKGSLQHSSELQESLERWQELAEVTEGKAKILEEQISTLTFQQESNEKQIEILKEQKSKAEEEWQQTKAELESLKTDEGYAANEAATEIYIDEASKRMVFLETTLLEITQEQQEQNLWFQLNLQNRLQQINQLKNEIAQTNISLESESDNLSELVTTQSVDIETLKEEINKANEQLTSTKNQLEASDADLKHHIEAIEKQGHHLAEIQERLVERELQLKKAAAIIKKQSGDFKYFQQKAAKHIKKLQAKVN